MLINTVWIVGRFIHFASLFFLVTSSFFFIHLLPDKLLYQLANRWLRWQRLALWIAALSTIALIAGQIGMMGITIADLAQPDTLSALLTLSIGQILLWEIVIVALALLVQHALLRQQKYLFFITLLLLLPLACLGHAAVHEGVLGLLQRINQGLHLLAAAYWSAGLLLLCTCLPYFRYASLRQDALCFCKRFSYFGHFAVFIVIISGISSTLLITGLPYYWNDYGKLLTLKIMLVVIMTAIALYNRYWLVPHFKTVNTAQQRYHQLFKSTSQFACLLGFIVLVLVAIFATLSPN